jgi:hypothetical protein
LERSTLIENLRRGSAYCPPATVDRKAMTLALAKRPQLHGVGSVQVAVAGLTELYPCEASNR